MLFILLLTLCSWLDFSNALSKQDLKVLAEMDDQEVVREVQVGQSSFSYSFYVFSTFAKQTYRSWNVVGFK